MHFSCDGVLLPWGWLNTYPPVGSDDSFCGFALLEYVPFDLSIKVSLSQPMNDFLALPFWLSPLFLQEGDSRQLYGADLPAGAKP